MYDEQLYFQTNRIPKLEKVFQNIKNVPLASDSTVVTEAEKSKLKKFF